MAFKEAAASIPTAVIVDSAFTSPFSVFTYWLRLFLGFLRSSGPTYITSSRTPHGFWLRDLPAFLGSYALGRPVINHLHGNDFLLFKAGLKFPFSSIVDWCYSRISVACVPSSNLVSQYRDYPFTRKIVVQNFYDPDILKSSLHKSSSGRIELLYLSNFIASKGFVLACDAAEILFRKGFNIHLTLCGSPIGTPQMSSTEVKRYLQSLSNKNFITVLGHVSGKTKLDVLGRSHVIMLPTRYPTEAAPICLIEGLAAGCYVISTDQGSIPDLLFGAAASIVDSSADSFAKAVEDFILNKNFHLIAAHNRQIAVNRFSPEKYRASIRDVIHEKHSSS